MVNNVKSAIFGILAIVVIAAAWAGVSNYVEAMGYKTKYDNQTKELGKAQAEIERLNKLVNVGDDVSAEFVEGRDEKHDFFSGLERELWEIDGGCKPWSTVALVEPGPVVLPTGTTAKPTPAAVAPKDVSTQILDVAWKAYCSTVAGKPDQPSYCEAFK